MMPNRLSNSLKNNLSESGKIQEIFLNHCRKNKIPVVLSNNNGSADGVIAGFDQETIILESKGQQMLYYKAAVSSIIPKLEVNFIFNDAWRSRPATSYGDFATY